MMYFMRRPELLWGSIHSTSAMYPVRVRTPIGPLTPTGTVDISHQTIYVQAIEAAMGFQKCCQLSQYSDIFSSNQIFYNYISVSQQL